jgi:hypothetical protein
MRFDPKRIPIHWPPLGVWPNFRISESIAPQGLATFGFCMTVIAIFLGLRMHCRPVVARGWTMDDYMLAALLLFLTFYFHPSRLGCSCIF